MQQSSRSLTVVGNIAGLLLVLISFAGLQNWLMNDCVYHRNAILATIALYGFTLVLGLLRLIGFTWVRIPIALISLAGIVLNTYELFLDLNHKDAVEVLAFLVVFIAIVVDYMVGRGLRK